MPLLAISLGKGGEGRRGGEKERERGKERRKKRRIKGRRHDVVEKQD